MALEELWGVVVSAVHRVLQSTESIAPAIRRRSSRVRSFVEREEISRGIAAGRTIRAQLLQHKSALLLLLPPVLEAASLPVEQFGAWKLPDQVAAE